MTAFNEADWSDWPSDVGCCSRGALIVYRSGLIDAHCLEGTQDVYGDIYMSCSASYRMFGEIWRLLGHLRNVS